MSTVVVRYKLYWEGGRGYPPYFTDPEVTFEGGVLVDEEDWYYGYLTAVNPEYWIGTMWKYQMEIGGMPLAPFKATKIAAIDNRTVELIATGFPFDGQYFSMTETAQRTWVSLGTALSLNMLTFPLIVSKVDETAYTVENSTALMQFLGAYMLYQSGPDYPLAKGRVLKARVTAATTMEELNAIIDDR